MDVLQTIVPPSQAQHHLRDLSDFQPHLVLAFATRDFIEANWQPDTLKQALPNSRIVGCSTAGQVYDAGLSTQQAVLTGIRFDQPNIRVEHSELHDMSESLEAGRHLAKRFADDVPRALIVFGQGISINGSAIIQGINQILGDDVSVFGGLAGDSDHFERTLVIEDDIISDTRIVAIGLYAPLSLKTTTGGGWEAFGPPRCVTEAQQNILYKLDDRPALDVYREYLGSYADELPKAALLFPLSVLSNDLSANRVTRTILGIDEDSGALTLAGDIHVDEYIQLMHTVVDQLVEAAEIAAADVQHDPAKSTCALIVSCVGRMLLMGDESADEVFAVRRSLGDNATLCGFYSYGEIGPCQLEPGDVLHNQSISMLHICE